MSDAESYPSVGIAGHGGMPGMPPLPLRKDDKEEDSGGTEEKEPSPPLRMGLLVDEVYHRVGAANDLVIVKGEDGRLATSDFHVMFSRKERVKGGPPKAPSSLLTMNKAVHVYVNGVLQPQLYLRVKEDGFCTFPDGRLQPPPETLLGGVGLVHGVNSVRFEIRYFRDPRVLVAECFAFLWDANTPMIVVDIDGTITRSDVPGLLMTITPGLIADHMHSGICELLTRIVAEGAQVVYLTSRPIVLAPKTRAFLTSTKQNGMALPLGPLQCCLDKVTGVLWRELVQKNMHDYKIAALLDLARPFREAGRIFGEAVFAAGIGNKLNDAVAYKAAGIPGDFIFIIDPESNLQVWNGDSSKLEGNKEGKVITPKESSPKLGTGHKVLSASKRWWSSSDSDSGMTSLNNSNNVKESDSSLQEVISFTPIASPNPLGSATEAPNTQLSSAAQSLGIADNTESTQSLAPASTRPNPEEAIPPLTVKDVKQGPERCEEGHGETSETTSTSPAAADGKSDGAATEQAPSAGNNSTTKSSSEGGTPAEPTATVSSPNTVANGDTSPAPATGGVSSSFQSYGDERFFTRLRASLDLAAWEAHKAVEAGVYAASHAAQETNLSFRMGVHDAVSAGRKPLVPRADGAETGEQAALRLAERVHSMSSTGATRSGGGNSVRGAAGVKEVVVQRTSSGGITGFFLPTLERKSTE